MSDTKFYSIVPRKPVTLTEYPGPCFVRFDQKLQSRRQYLLDLLRMAKQRKKLQRPPPHQYRLVPNSILNRY